MISEDGYVGSKSNNCERRRRKKEISGEMHYRFALPFSKSTLHRDLLLFVTVTRATPLIKDIESLREVEYENVTFLSTSFRYPSSRVLIISVK